jgi:hypothetical protein
MLEEESKWGWSEPKGWSIESVLRVCCVRAYMHALVLGQYIGTKRDSAAEVAFKVGWDENGIEKSRPCWIE